MSLVLEAHDSLPYIDHDISELDREKANTLIAKELQNGYLKNLHPSLPSLAPPKVSDLIEAEVKRIQSGAPRESGIDLSRYEAPDQPAADSDVDTWRADLRNAYISRSYLSGRHVNLSLLDEVGKNAWLIGNSQVEDIEHQLDRELTHLKEEIEEVNRARKFAQEASKAELLSLEETWKNGIGKAIEVQLATEGLRHEIVNRRRLTAREEP